MILEVRGENLRAVPEVVTLVGVEVLVGDT